MALTINDVGKWYKCRLTPYFYIKTVGGVDNFIASYLGQIYDESMVLQEKCLVFGPTEPANLKYKVCFDAWCVLQKIDFEWTGHPLDATAMPVLVMGALMDTVGVAAQDNRFVTTSDISAAAGSQILESKNTSDLTIWGNPKARVKVPWNSRLNVVGNEYYYGLCPEIFNGTLSYAGNDIATHLTNNFIDNIYVIYGLINLRVVETTATAVRTKLRNYIIRLDLASSIAIAKDVADDYVYSSDSLINSCDGNIQYYSRNVLIRTTDNVTLNTDDLNALFADVSFSSSGLVLSNGISMNRNPGTYTSNITAELQLSYTIGTGGRVTAASIALLTPPATYTYSNLDVFWTVTK